MTHDGPEVEGPDDADTWDEAEDLPVDEVRDLFVVLAKALRAYQLYDRNNPVYRRFLESLAKAFAVVWETEDALHLIIEERRITWKGVEVYRNDSRTDSLAFLLYRDGVRELTPLPGIEEGELEEFLEVLRRARHARGDADDLVTLLWEGDFTFLRYEIVDILADGVEMPEKVEGRLDGSIDILVAEGFTFPAPGDDEDDDAGDDEARPIAPPDGTIRTQDFNPTLYALDPADRDYVAAMLVAELDRDLRHDVLSALFDRLEDQGRPDREREIAEILEQLLPNLLSRGWIRHVGWMLGELEEIRRRRTLDPKAEKTIDSVMETLAGKESIEELVRALEDGALTPTSSELATFLRHLRGSALAPLLSAVETTPHPQIRRILRDAIREIARASPDGVLRLLQSADVNVVSGAVRLVGVIGIPQAADTLARLLETAPIPVRRAVVESATGLSSPGLFAALERSLYHPDRDLRIGAARALGGAGHRKAVPVLEEILSSPEMRDADVAEKLAFFEAYGRLAGGQGVSLLSRLLNAKGFLGFRENSEVRAASARGLGVIGNAEAIQALDRSATDTDPLVRSAVGRALRGGEEAE